MPTPRLGGPEHAVPGRRLLAAAALVGGLALATAPAAAASGWITLMASCDNGETLVFTYADDSGQGAFPRALHIVDSTSTFTIHEFIVTRTGQTFAFTWIGFFTPA